LSSPWPQRWLRPAQDSSHDVHLDLLWLVVLTLLLVGTGIGLRDPWPADEPRFALIARDMVASGRWLVPLVGGDLYADKPPLYFWLLALALKLTGSLRLAFLVPSLLSALGCVILVYDLARRLWTRETGLIAGTLLLLTVQFVWQARQAQIDATLCFWTTLSLYGLLRHALLGPRWSWYAIGWAAAGFGVITKGVGFLPLLILIPLWVLQRRWYAVTFNGGARSLIGPLAFVLAVSVWLVPMLVAAQFDPALQAYRDEILFEQTVERYAGAWHHLEPFWYYVVEVIPVLWLPLTALLPWLAPRWRDAWRARDLTIASLLIWCALVVLFFSSSAGKRGVYVLPAVPGLVLACAPYVAELARRRGAQRAIFGLSTFIVGACLVAGAYAILHPDIRTEVNATYGLDPLGPLLLIVLAGVIACIGARPPRALLAYAGTLASILLIVSFWINPAMNEIRSGRAFVARVQDAADPVRELALVAFKEQYLLYLHRPIVHFGHARWREPEEEAADAARWLSERDGRQLVVNAGTKKLCFSRAKSTPLGEANRTEWFLVLAGADADCVQQGDADVAIRYVPPTSVQRYNLRDSRQGAKAAKEEKQTKRRQSIG
jgi:4-amino-4-deoxy-L-arabinose transferase-like glycosyltransferase